MMDGGSAMQMTEEPASALPLERPAPLARAALRLARARAARAQAPGRLAGLVAAEARCEAARRTRGPAYRPSRHVQILGALLAALAARQPKASGSEDLRSAI
jgi:hypothetical protein